ncbi:MAG: RDD family protein [Gordonia sp. (in: high G+C Gram-positive bacteria)]
MSTPYGPTPGSDPSQPDGAPEGFEQQAPNHSTPGPQPSPYGQPQYGASPYSASPYSASPYSAPQYGQPQYGTQPYGASSYGAPPYGQPQYGYPGPYGQTPQPGPQYAVGFDQSTQGFTPQANTGYVAVAGLGAVQVATLGQRLLARLIDSVVYGVVYGICILVGGSIAASAAPTCTLDPYTYQRDCTGGGTGVVALLVIIFVAFAFGLLYEWLMIALAGATLGKMALRLKVVDQATGAPIGLGRAFIRQVIPFVGSIFLYIGMILVYLSPLLDGSGRMQGWHDKAANDLVIVKR